jgi:hypothetical protein
MVISPETLKVGRVGFEGAVKLVMERPPLRLAKF